MFWLSCASKAVRAIAREHGFTAASLWEPVNAGRGFWDMPADMVCVRVRDAKGRTLDITAGELRRVGELVELARRREEGQDD